MENKSILYFVEEPLIQKALLEVGLLVWDEFDEQYYSSQELQELILKHSDSKTSKTSFSEKSLVVEQLCEQFREVFPDSKHKLGIIAGSPVRESVTTLSTKMEKWIKTYYVKYYKKDYGVDKFNDLILKSTKSYVDRCIKNNSFIMKSGNFIYKGSPEKESALLNAIEMYLENNPTNENRESGKSEVPIW
jgi:hypothetical protein